MGELAKLHSDLSDLVGKLIHDRYRVDSLLGVGGMGAVFKGYHTGLKRDVAIKLLHPEIGRDESVSKRFDREAYSASRLDHPNCVRVSDFGTTETGAKYLVMEFLEGAELEASLGKPWAPLDAVRVAEQMFAGLEHAHHFGVVHRDLKPENVFVTTDFRGQQLVKLVDFGIAKLIDGEGAQEKLTRQGLVFGTPRYMSPEQAAGGKIDERTDLYAGGLILYEMLAGHAPFDAEEPGQLLRMHIMAPPPPLPSGLPAGLVALVDKLLEKSKSDRYANAREVIDVLRALDQELTAAPVAALAPVVVAAPETDVAPIRKSGWQPAVPTTSLPAPPPPTTASMTQPSVPAPIVQPAAPMGMTVPMIVAPGPLPAPTPTGSHPSLSFGNTTASQSWVNTSSHPAVPQPIEQRAVVAWVIAGAALLVAALAFAALLMNWQDDPASSDPSIEAAPADAKPAREPVLEPTQPADSKSDSKSGNSRKPAPKKEPAKAEPAKPKSEETHLLPVFDFDGEDDEPEPVPEPVPEPAEDQPIDPTGKGKGKGKDKKQH